MKFIIILYYFILCKKLDKSDTDARTVSTA